MFFYHLTDSALCQLGYFSLSLVYLENNKALKEQNSFGEIQYMW